VVVTRAYLVPIGLAVAVAAAAATVTVEDTITTRREASLAEAYVIALAADLRRDRDALDTAIAHLDEQLRYADLLLDWADVGTGGSSATRMDALSALDGLDDPDITRATFDDLRFTGRGRLLSEPRLREALVAYYDRAAEAGRIGDAQVAEFTAWLDRSLDRGAWLHVHGEDVSGRYPLDFKAITERLRGAGLATAVRSARRGIEARRSALLELSGASATLIDGIEGALAR
jgi:hypothetical protein